MSNGFHVCDVMLKPLDEQFAIVERWMRDPTIVERTAGVKKHIRLDGLWTLSNSYYPGWIETVDRQIRDESIRKAAVAQLKSKGKHKEAQKLSKPVIKPCTTLTATADMMAAARKVFADLESTRFFIAGSGKLYGGCVISRFDIISIIYLHVLFLMLLS